MSKDKKYHKEYSDSEAFDAEDTNVYNDNGKVAEDGDVEVLEPSDDDVEEVDVEDVEVPEPETEVEELKKQVENEKKEYMFLMAEFENFRKRTMKEKAELIKNGGEKVLKGLLPILDDFERGIKAASESSDASSLLEGMELIYNKLKQYLEQNGVKEMDPADDNFDTELHEAISVVPVPDEDKKGKILDTVQKGYMLNGKVLRHAKVVVGQ